MFEEMKAAKEDGSLDSILVRYFFSLWLKLLSCYFAFLSLKKLTIF